MPRAAGASVVLVDGVAALYLDRGGRSVQTLPAFDDVQVQTTVVAALRVALAADGRDRHERELVVVKVDGRPVAESPYRESLLAAGFAPGYRGLVLR